CCGPKFSVKFWISGIAAILQVELITIVVANDLRDERARLDRDGLVNDAAFDRVVAHLDVADERKILAERMADEAVVREQPTQIGMTAEQDAVEIERLALEPIGRRPDAPHGVDDRSLV